MTMREKDPAPIEEQRKIRLLVERATAAQLRVLLADIRRGKAWFDQQPMGRA